MKTSGVEPQRETRRGGGHGCGITSEGGNMVLTMPMLLAPMSSHLLYDFISSSNTYATSDITTRNAIMADTQSRS